MTKGGDLFRKCYGIIYIIVVFNIFIAVKSQSCDQIQGTPTVYPAGSFDPINDAENLHKAMATFKADTEAIVEVLTKRDLAQRLEIAKTYKTHYGKDLNDKLSLKLFGNVKEIVTALMTPLPQYYAEQLQCALVGPRTNEKTILQIFYTLNNSEIETIAKAYEQSYDATLERDLMAGTSGSFHSLIVSILEANRDGSAGVDEANATVDAQALLDADTHDDKVTQFNKILVNRSNQQLCAIFAEYKRISDHDIEENILRYIRYPERMRILTIVKSVKSKVGLFADSLNSAMNGIIADHSLLIRIIVTRSEIDLGNIKQAFLDKYEETLASRITTDTKGYYQKVLLSLVGN